MKRLLIVDEVQNRKCPLNRRRCMVDGCALWINAGLKRIHGGGYYGGLYRVGYCTLGRNQ